MNSKTIKIFTEGGISIGYGHLARCLSLYEEIRNRGIDVELIAQGDIEGVDFLKVKPIISKEWKNIEYLNETITNEDYVIVDSYKANKDHYEIISAKSKKAMFIDDNSRIKYPKGIIVNPALDSQNVDYSYVSNNIILTGPEYVILRSAFTNVERKDVKREAHKVLVVMGGTDVRNMTSVILDKICERNQDIDFSIVLNSLQLKNNASVNTLKNVIFHKNLNEKQMCQIMLDSDLAITAAGQTIYELMSTQTPFIAIQVAENQQNNINALKENISPKVVLKYDEENFHDKLYESFEGIKGYDFRKDLIGKLKSIIDGNGSKRIIDALICDLNTNYEIYLRKALAEDILDVFELSNEEYVRKHSINKDAILWDEHVKWFSNALHDKSIIFYVVSDKRNTFLGQVRYNLEEDHAIVSISLSNILKGKGHAKFILSQSISKLFNEKMEIYEIIAFVSESNIASMKIFKGLNFIKTSAENGLVKLILRRNEYCENRSI